MVLWWRISNKTMHFIIINYLIWRNILNIIDHAVFSLIIQLKNWKKNSIIRKRVEECVSIHTYIVKLNQQGASTCVICVCGDKYMGKIMLKTSVCQYIPWLVIRKVFSLPFTLLYRENEMKTGKFTGNHR